MSLVLTVAPALEPVSLEEAKAHLRVDHADEDAFIASLIVTSRLHIEAGLGLALITQTWTERLDAWPSGRGIELSLRPVRSVAAVRVANASNAFELLPSSSYLLDASSQAPRIVWRDGAPRPLPAQPAAGIEIAFEAGYGGAPEAVPAPIRHALLVLLAHWYEQREPVEISTKVIPLPQMVDELLAPYRARRL